MGRMIVALLGIVLVVGGGVGHADQGAPAEKQKTMTLYLDAANGSTPLTARVKMEFVWIKPGKFMMGSPEGEIGRDARGAREKRHEVTLTKGYWMQTTEVTQGQWEAVMLANPSHFKGDPNLPVEQVSWDDFQVFIRKVSEKGKGQLAGLTVDLPTEAEWEYACRAGGTGLWSFGEDEEKLGEYAWYNENSDGKTHPVGQKKANAWGLYDMHGNVWEWCKDWYGEYSGDANDSQGPSTGQYRLFRGGSWNYNDLGSRSANRSWTVPEVRDNYVGGRVVLRLPARPNKFDRSGGPAR